MMIKELAARGAFWSVIDVVGGQVLAFGAFMLLARLLSPGDYGLVTLAWAVIALPSIVLQEGLGEALVQRDSLQTAHINTALWANIALATLFIVLIQIGAGWLGALTAAPNVAPVLRWISPTMLFAALGSISGSIFRRNLNYAAFALRTVISIASGAVVGIVMALLHFGVWALVGMQLTTAAMAVIVLWSGTDWRPQFRFSFGALSDIYQVSSRLMLSNAVRFAAERVDTVIIAVFLGTTQLGFYYLATRLVATVTMTILPVDTIMMPVLARMQSDQKRLSKTYLDMFWLGNAFWVPAMAGFGMISPIAIPLFFGAQWQPAVPLMLIVSGTCLTYALTRPTQHLLLSRGRPDAMAKLNALQLALAIIAFLAGVQAGITGAAIAFVAVALAMISFHLRAARRIAGIEPRAVLKRYVPIIAAAAIMVAVLCILAHLGWDKLATLAAEILIGPCVYAAALYLFARSQVNYLLAIVRDMLPGRR